MIRAEFRLVFCSWLLLAGNGAQAAAAPPITPEQWLARMQQALQDRNYQGVYVYEHSGSTQQLRIVHRSGAEGGAERVQQLDGTGREFIRNGRELLCYLPDLRTVLVDSSPDSSSLLAAFRNIDTRSSGQYRVRELEPAVFSGRTVRVIAVESRDRFRYGYRLWLDEKTALPLKTQLRGARDEIVEQLWFTELTLPREISNSSFAPQTDASDFRWLRRESQSSLVGQLPADTSEWQAAELPPGFQMTASALQQLPGSAAPVAHMVYSDGLASVSVFVEQGAAQASGAAPTVDDVKRLGSSSAYSTFVSGYRVTAIGEVPPDTVKAIAGSTINAQHSRGISPRPPRRGR